MKKIILITIVTSCLLTIRCVDSTNNRSEKNDPYSAWKLKNKKLNDILASYIKENSIDSKVRILTLDFYNMGHKSFFHLTQAKTKIYLTRSPDYYFIHEKNTLVLFFSGAGNFVSLADNNPELESVIKEMNISLSDEISEYNPPSWDIILCDEEATIRKKFNPLIIDFLPCKYSVRRDSVNFQKYYLIEE